MPVTIVFPEPWRPTGMASVVASAFGRYLLVGCAASAVHYAILIALVERAGAAAVTAAALGAAANGALVGIGTLLAGLHYLSAQLLATVFVLLSGFLLNRCWSFA